MKKSSVSICTVLVTVVVLIWLSGAADALGDRRAYPSETVFDEEFSVKPGGLLEVNVSDMDIEVAPGAKNRATVKVVVSGPDLDKALEYYEKLDFRADVSGNVLSVETRRSRSWISFDWSWKGRRGVKVQARITVPPEFDLDVKTSDGDVQAERIEGEIILKTSDGDVDVGELSGSLVRLITSDGDITADDLRSDRIWIKTSDGDLLATDIEGDDVGMATSDGDVTVKRLEAKSVEMSSSDGDIVVKGVDANSIEIKTSDGDVDVDASGKELRIRTSDGDIRLEIADNMSVYLTTSDGNITLNGPPDLRADLNLKGGRVKLVGGVNIQGEVGTRRVVGKLNNGGPKIHARASDGTIALNLR
jgi:hypothetical protein